MALQICPVCQERYFFWGMTTDEADREVTGWYCGACTFDAYEYEAYNPDGTYRHEHFERGCLGCGGTLGIKLYQDDKQYLWCKTCNRLTEQPTSLETT